jgi:hypothetical protein
MGVSRAEAAGLAGALLAHAVLLAVLGRSPASGPVNAAAPAGDADVEVELSPEPVVPSPVPEPELAPLRGGSAAPLLASRALPPAASPVHGAPGAGASDGVSPAAPAEAPLDVRAPLSLSADAIGLGGRNVFLGALPDGAGPAPQKEGPPANVAPGVQQSLRDALHERDHGIGLDIGGPVVAVAEELTRPSNTPLNSRAVFEVIADADGNVTSVSLVDVSQGRSEWEHIAASLGQALRTRKLHVPAGTGGVTMTLEVASRWQLPSGHDPETEVSVLGIPVKKAPRESKQPKKVEILKPELKIVEAPPQPETPTGVKLPQYQLHVVDLFSLDIDPTDLTPRPLRVVHARIVRERVL